MSLLLLPILAHALTVSAGDTSEVLVRSDDAGQHVDLVTIGRLALNLGLKRTNWTLYYSPSISQLSLGESDSALVLYNAGGLNASLRLSSRTTVNLLETAGYGVQNLRALAVAAPQPNPNTLTDTPAGANAGSAPGTTGSNLGVTGPNVLAAPEYATIRFGAVSSGAGVTYVLDRKWTTGAFASYAISGGLDSYSESVIPRARMYSGTTSLSRRLGPLDQGIISANANYTLTDPTAEAFFATLSITWTHRFDKWIATSVSTGEAYAESTALDGTHYTALLPMASANFTLSKTKPVAGGRVSATVGASIAPLIDRLSGSVVEMLTTSAGASWNRRRLALQVAAFGATAIGHQNQAGVASFHGASESGTYKLDRRHWFMAAGTQQAWQRFSNGQQLPLLWAAFIAITYTTSTRPL